jgi:hypothetical protein
MENIIGFSHNYPKLHNQNYGKLLHVAKFMRHVLSPEFITYDTAYVDLDPETGCKTAGAWPLPPGKYLVLFFAGNLLIPFTTVRSYNVDKELFYRLKIGEWFKIVMEKKK